MNNYNNERGGGFNKHKGGGNRGGFGGGRPNFGGDRRGGGGRDRDDRPAQMYAATCASCQKSCEVPFRPSGDKPVYCSNCFGKKQDDAAKDFKGGDRNSYSRPQSNNSSIRHEHPNDRKQVRDDDVSKRLTVIEAKLNRILDLINPPIPAMKKGKPPMDEETAKRKEVDAPALKAVVERALAVEKPKKVATKKAVKKAVKKATKKK